MEGPMNVKTRSREESRKEDPIFSPLLYVDRRDTGVRKEEAMRELFLPMEVSRAPYFSLMPCCQEFLAVPRIPDLFFA